LLIASGRCDLEFCTEPVNILNGIGEFLSKFATDLTGIFHTECLAVDFVIARRRAVRRMIQYGGSFHFTMTSSSLSTPVNNGYLAQ
jgi:hypothetical protein